MQVKTNKETLARLEKYFKNANVENFTTFFIGALALESSDEKWDAAIARAEQMVEMQATTQMLRLAKEGAYDDNLMKQASARGKREYNGNGTDDAYFEPDSTNIKSVRYFDSRTQKVLTIEFKNGSVYDYFDVPFSVFYTLWIRHRRKESVGSHFNSVVKGKYQSYKVK